MMVLECFWGLDSHPAMKHGCLPMVSHVRRCTGGVQDNPGRAVACLTVDMFLPSFLPVTVCFYYGSFPAT